ncbi:MAG: UPF0158 family protein [Desulfotomaculaceae bacterium]|nr:UPF0158 family protein [Desulfotomaculaceae bacterium]MDD4766871.1 UPF0158 family protein [Desulfotomaculaceae bacterium]
MRQVPVIIAWIINAFENSSQHSEYYVDLQTGDVKFFSALDFPEHAEVMKRLDRQTERFVRLPKIEKEFSLQVKKDYIATIEDQNLKSQLENELEADARYRRILMDYEDERRQWYKFQDEKYADYLKKWFMEKGIELVEK